jgi:hypothetical protein
MHNRSGMLSERGERPIALIAYNACRWSMLQKL